MREEKNIDQLVDLTALNAGVVFVGGPIASPGVQLQPPGNQVKTAGQVVTRLRTL